MLNSSKTINKVLIACFVSMLLQAFIDSSKGVFMPVFEEFFKVGELELSWYLASSSLFYVIGTLISAKIIEKKGRKFLSQVAIISMALGLFILINVNEFYYFLLSTIFTNIGLAFAAISINTLIQELEIKNKAVLMNFTHFLYGLGVSIMHKYSGLFLSKGFKFQEIYKIIILALVGFFLYTSIIKFPEANIPVSQEKKQKQKFSKGVIIRILVFSISLGLYAAAELQSSNWLVAYSEKGLNIGIKRASEYSAMFFIFFSFGRLVGGFVAEKIGYLKSVKISLLLGAIFYFIALSMNVGGMILLSISGVLFSIVFPTMILIIKDFFTSKIASITSISVAIASLSNLIASLLMGYIAKEYNVQTAMKLIPIFLILSFAFLSFLKKKKT